MGIMFPFSKAECACACECDVRQVSRARKGMRPILVTVNSPRGREYGECRALRGRRTSLDLLAELNPEALRIRVVAVDELGKEEYDSCSPEHCAL